VGNRTLYDIRGCYRLRFGEEHQFLIQFPAEPLRKRQRMNSVYIPAPVQSSWVAPGSNSQHPAARPSGLPTSKVSA
jgi:hypothetical protein